MKQFLIKDVDYNLIVNLSSNTNILGTFVPINTMETTMLDSIIPNDVNSIVGDIQYDNLNKIISSHADVIEHFTPSENKYIVTGVTDSKFTLIDQYIKKEHMRAYSDVGQNFTRKYGTDKKIIREDIKNELSRVGVKCGVHGGVFAMILHESNKNEHEYVLYLDTPNPIKYVDLSDGSAIFSYVRTPNEQQENQAQILLFEGFSDDPKIISEVFIDRGVNSVFEKFKKLKVVKDLNELTKMGFGFYKINTKGFDFKNK